MAFSAAFVKNSSDDVSPWVWPSCLHGEKVSVPPATNNIVSCAVPEQQQQHNSAHAVTFASGEDFVTGVIGDGLVLNCPLLVKTRQRWTYVRQGLVATLYFELAAAGCTRSIAVIKTSASASPSQSCSGRAGAACMTI